MSWNLDDYEPVEDRLRAFWDDHPAGQIQTELLAFEADRYIVRATVWKEAHHLVKQENDYFEIKPLPDATGLAEETVGSTPVNKTSALENCETSAIGRALANLGYAAKGKRPSREEMDKPARDRSQRPSTGTDMECPECGDGVWDNREENDRREANGQKRRPDFKCRKCEWIQWNAETATREDFEPRDDIPAPELQESDDPTFAPF